MRFVFFLVPLCIEEGLCFGGLLHIFSLELWICADGNCPDVGIKFLLKVDEGACTEKKKQIRYLVFSILQDFAKAMNKK